MTTWIIQTDGGSRGNPGQAASAFVVIENGQVLVEKKHFLGIATNNEAEYDGLISSLQWIASQDISRVEKIVWETDSLLMASQVNKLWKIKESRLLRLATEVWNLLAHLSCEYEIHHIPREKNAHADSLVNIELDAQE